MLWWREACWSVPSTQKWKNTDSQILPPAFQVTTHLEIFLFVCPPPHRVGPSLPLWPLPVGLGSTKSVQPVHHFLCASVISFMTGTWFMVFFYLEQVGGRGTRRRGNFNQTDATQILGSWVSASSLSLGFLLCKTENGTSLWPA